MSQSKIGSLCHYPLNMGFKAGQGGFAAGASAVVLKSGVATTPNFVDGVAVVVQPIGGVMVEAAIGGQQFTYQAK